MRLAALVEQSSRIAATRSRREKLDLLVEILRQLQRHEVAAGVAFLSGSLPQGRIGVGAAALRSARAEAGVAPTAALQVQDVAQALERVAAARGRGSASERARILGELFSRATAPEQDFLTRLLFGELRQGALEGLMEEAIAAAGRVEVAAVRRALMVSGDPAAVAEAALRDGGPGLDRFSLRLMLPLRPMLAQPAEDLGDALARLGEAELEWKLDGARVQVHREGDAVRVFTRSLRDVTGSVPEIVASVRALPLRSAVLDGEAIALRPDGAPQPFQVSMRRFTRRSEVERMQGELPLSVFFFDLLHLDGSDLLAAPESDRVAALDALLPLPLRVPRLRTADAAAADAFLAEALRIGHEGVMAKDPHAPYEAGRRGAAWFKVKPAQTLDLVVLAAEWGHGRRRGWLSNLHLGARDPESGGYVMLGKTFKGLDDATLAWQTAKLRELAIGEDGFVVHVRPELVAEIAFSDLQESPRYPGGLALRFARLRRYRTDKAAGEADTISTVRGLFSRQRGSHPR
jgi:ATP-dependent DNA ligase I